ncbi:MAG: DUF4125 family protein [Anaerococcus vaginalis]|uniref:DUF4125 domain-containing protein n=1 Tax=Anaerococcus vaginalis TaxID=33037 RepID=A0A6N2SIE6_9FIRM|nr:DUF4125 family protein [Anaerococcus vaginalis]MDU4378918.1 DUF4125 family protein [Anaerococcus vaginalis]MDU5824649.1 DUF4125 family protein [Anaerococcus vaginalis]
MRYLFKNIDKNLMKDILRDYNLLCVFDELSWILDFEWKNFDEIRGLNGRAVCQDSPKEFFIMRLSQYLAYNQKIIDYLYKDLKQIEKNGVNPIFDKYARMMEFTDKDKFEDIKQNLEELSPVKVHLLENIKKILNNKSKNIPKELKRVRPTKSQDKRISSNDYYVAEITCLSLKTLWAIEEMIESPFYNLEENIYKNTKYLFEKVNN